MAAEIWMCVCEWKTEAAASVRPFYSLVVVKARSSQLHPVKTTGMGGQGEKKEKKVYGSKKKYIIPLSQAPMLPVGQS